MTILQKLKDALPRNWFPDNAPILTALLSGWASAWQHIVDMLDYVRLQLRLATATGPFLDFIIGDFFGDMLGRRTDESDTAYRSRAFANIVRRSGTRESVITSIRNLTGSEPVVFEPRNVRDTGSYRAGGAAYGIVGGWGSLRTPLQGFVTVTSLPAEVPPGDVPETLTAVKPVCSSLWFRVE